MYVLSGVNVYEFCIKETSIARNSTYVDALGARSVEAPAHARETCLARCGEVDSIAGMQLILVVVQVHREKALAPAA